MNKVFCPNCGSPNLEYSESVDLLQCLNCNVVIWNEDILNSYKYPVATRLSPIKLRQLSDYPDDEKN